MFLTASQPNQPMQAAEKLDFYLFIGKGERRLSPEIRYMWCKQSCLIFELNKFVLLGILSRPPYPNKVEMGMPSYKPLLYTEIYFYPSASNTAYVFLISSISL